MCRRRGVLVSSRRARRSIMISRVCEREVCITNCRTCRRRRYGMTFSSETTATKQRAGEQTGILKYINFAQFVIYLRETHAILIPQ